MDDFSEFSQEEQFNYFKSLLGVDQEIWDQYVEPRKEAYGVEFLKIIHQEGAKQHEKKMAFSFAFSEAMVRSKIRKAFKTSIDNTDIVKKLLPCHKELESSLEEARIGLLDFSAPLTKIYLQEESASIKLLEELTQIIRECSRMAGSVENLLPLSSESPITNAVEQVQMEVRKKLKQETREENILVTVKPEALERVMVAFLPFISSEQEQTLLQLFTTGSSPEPIYFNESRLILGDIFRRLKDKKVLIGVVFYTEIAKWLSQHFYFKNKKKKGFTPVSEKSIKDVMQNGEKPKNGVNLNLD